MKTTFKNHILGLFFHRLMSYKGYKERYERLQKRNWDLEDQLKAISDCNINKEKLIQLLNQFILDKSEILLSIQADKDGIYNLVALRESEGSNLFEIKIYNAQRGLHSPVCILAPEYTSTNNIFIEDFTGTPNHGLGSMAMEALIKLAKEKKINSIKGKITYGDYVDHIDRLTHFYTKHGFHISLDEKSKTGKIVRDLKEITA